MTAAIVLLASSSTVSPIDAALHRVVEILLGTGIGIAVSISVLPSRARQICFERSAEVLTLLAQLLVLHLQPPEATKREDVERLSDGIRAGLGKVATAAQEARREHTIRMDEDPVPERLVRALRRLRIDVVFVGRATAASDFDWQRLGPVLGEVAGSFRAAFETLAGALRQGSSTSAPSPDLAAVDFSKLDEAIAKLGSAIDAGAGDPAASRKASVLPFVIETLRRDLGELADALVRPATS